MLKKLKKYIRLKIKKFNYIINNFENIVKKKEKQILAKRKEILAKLKEQEPQFKIEFRSSLVIGCFLYFVYNIFNIYYGDFFNLDILEIPEVNEENYPDIKMCKAIITYDLPQIEILKNNILIPWIENNLADIHDSPIEGFSCTPIPILID